MKQLLETLVKEMVTDPHAVSIEAAESSKSAVSASMTGGPSQTGRTPIGYVTVQLAPWPA